MGSRYLRPVHLKAVGYEVYTIPYGMGRLSTMECTDEKYREYLWSYYLHRFVNRS